MQKIVPEYFKSVISFSKESLDLLKTDQEFKKTTKKRLDDCREELRRIEIKQSTKHAEINQKLVFDPNDDDFEQHF
jgi:hypothetical protein